MLPARLQADLDGLERLAALLVQADSPLIVAEYVGRTRRVSRRSSSWPNWLAVPVVDKFQRHNLPDQPSHGPDRPWDAAIEQADLILLLDNLDAFGSLNVPAADHQARPRYPPKTKLVRLCRSATWASGAWAHNYHRLQPLDLDLYGDTAIAPPEARRALSARSWRRTTAPAGASASGTRGSRLSTTRCALTTASRSRPRSRAPISSVRLIGELAGRWPAATTAFSRLALRGRTCAA